MPVPMIHLETNQILVMNIDLDLNVVLGEALGKEWVEDCCHPKFVEVEAEEMIGVKVYYISTNNI